MRRDGTCLTPPISALAPTAPLALTATTDAEAPPELMNDAMVTTVSEYVRKLQSGSPR